MEYLSLGPNALQLEMQRFSLRNHVEELGKILPLLELKMMMMKKIRSLKKKVPELDWILLSLVLLMIHWILMKMEIPSLLPLLERQHLKDRLLLQQ